MRKIVWLLAAFLGWRIYQKAQLSYADTVTPVDVDVDPMAPEPLPADR